MHDAAKHWRYSNPICKLTLLQQTLKPSVLTFNNLPKFTMSDKCGNCDCADRSQCTKKGNTLVIETEKSYINTVVVETPADENDGKCKCGASCSCTNCTCGH